MDYLGHLGYLFKCGCTLAKLGRAQVPHGYHILQNRDGFYFWIRECDGLESEVYWDKWRVLRGAVAMSIKGETNGK
jgi:hypothetical protein